MLIRFDKETIRNFELKYFIPLRGKTGLYFIFLKNLQIPYPFKNSKLIYIGMSESRINSIGKRLRNHFTGESNNRGIQGYNAKQKVIFTYLENEFLKHIFSNSKIENIETFFLESFAVKYGSYPICNNKRGDINFIQSSKLTENVKIDWAFFEE